MTACFSLLQSVYSEDVDQYGIVYHPNYLKYFERARTEWLLDHGISLTESAKQHIYFVVSNANIDFLKPLKLHQKFIVDCEVKSHSRASLTFQQTIYDPSNDPIFCQAEVLIITINEHNKIIRLPKAIKETLT
jgi:acyl-CoA thioester hydrolase